MSTVIGTITLDNDLILDNEYEYSLINASVENTIGGGIVVQEFNKLEKGRNIVLRSTDSQGLQLKSTVDDLKELSDAGINNTYTLTISSNEQTFTKTVRFMTETSGGAVQAEPIEVRDGLHDDSIYYKVTIFLMVL